MKKTGDEYFDSDEFRDLLSEYEEAVRTGQPVFLDADELAEIADFYQMTEHPDEAERAITLALSLSPGAIAPLTYRIHEALYGNDIEAAKEFLNQITETDDPEYVYNEAEIMIAEGRIDDADAFLRKEYNSLPTEEQQDFVVDAASIFSDYGASDKAMEWMTRAKQEDSTDFKELMARTLFGLGKYKDSAKLWGELIDTDPFSKQYWNALATAQFMNEDYSNAVQSSEFAIAIDPHDPESLLSKANGLYRLGNYEGALDYYQRFSEQIPDDEFVLMHQGTCLINLARDEEAVALLKKSVEVAPDDSPYLCDIYQELAFGLSELGKTDEAVDYLNKTDELDCDHAQMEVIKGHVYLSADNLEQAEEHFRKAVIDSDNAPQTLMRVIVSLYDNKYVEASYKMFQQFFSIVPKNYPDGHAYMALCCYDLQKYDEFLRYLKIACKRNPKECRMVLNHLFPDDVEPKDYYEYIKKKIK